MSDYALHLQSLADIDKIREYVTGDSVDVANQPIETPSESMATVLPGEPGQHVSVVHFGWYFG